MAKVRIITDITAKLKPELVDRHQITVLPVDIRFGDEAFHIGPDNGTERLFRRMAGNPALLAEATIPSGVFQQAYSRLSRETSEILVLLSSSKLSNACAQAEAASRSFLGRYRIAVVDSMTASWGLGLVVEAAAKAADKGQSLDEIVRLVRGMLPHIYVVLFVERLDYLEKGNRIGPAQALLGTMLNIKPLLIMEEGEIIPLEKVRTRASAIEKLADFVGEFASVEQVVIMQNPLGTDTELLVEHLNLVLPGRTFPVIEYDAVLACHLGPDAMGVTVYEGL